MTEIQVENIVARLASQPGMRLLTYREVGIPYWDVPLRCRLLAKKSLPAIEEFALRCIEAELCTDRDVAAFLGLPEPVVQAVMGRLLSSGHIVPANSADSGNLVFSLTQRGSEVLHDLTEVVAEERTVNLAFDGLLHNFSLIDKSMRWRPRDLRDRGILEIPAFPADPPDIGPSSTAAVGSAIADIASLANHQLLSVLGLDGNREKFFLRAVALIFETTDAAQEVTVQFAIDGRPSPDHDYAFSRAEGQRKMGIIGSLRAEVADVSEIPLSAEILAQREDSVEVTALRRATETLRGRIGELQNRSTTSADENDGDQTNRMSRQIEELQAKLDEAEAALAQVPARLLEVHEHAALLVEAITSAQDRLLIVSPWIRAAVVDNRFISNLRSLLERGVHVRIAYGIDDGKRALDKDSRAESELRELADSSVNFEFVRLGDTHAKILLVDNRFVVATSFNWLSFRGDPKRPFRDERGTYVTVAAEIDRIFDDYSTRMEKARVGGAGRN